MSILLTAPESASAGSMIPLILMYVVVFGVFFYFVLYRPQKKEQKKTSAMLSTLEIGDCVLTTSGFYGIIIDITDDTVIVEFGNNKNCRIPMQKSAIVQVEKADAEAPDQCSWFSACAWIPAPTPSSRRTHNAPPKPWWSGRSHFSVRLILRLPRRPLPH